MIVLGIETSCDETAAAIVTDDRRIMGNVIYSQLDEHKAFGGVVPEIAARPFRSTLFSYVEINDVTGRSDFPVFSRRRTGTKPRPSNAFGT